MSKKWCGEKTVLIWPSSRTEKQEDEEENENISESSEENTGLLKEKTTHISQTIKEEKAEEALEENCRKYNSCHDIIDCMRQIDRQTINQSKARSHSESVAVECNEVVKKNFVVKVENNGHITFGSPYSPIFSNNIHTIFQPAYETSQSSNSIICRICYSADDELIAPCSCSGSSQYVHAKCLVTWFKKSVKNQCELCMAEVKIRKINHSLSLWKRPEDKPVPLIWFSVFFVGLFLNILSIYVNASELCKSTACLIFYVVNGFGIILDAAFLWFWFLKCRHYWKKWCALNQDWFIDDTSHEKDAPHVEFVRTEAV